jgi:8-oxo-dGTP diphosphatase
MKKEEFNLTHQVAVNAYLMDADKFLMLKRSQPPFIWVPPGGRLHENENPVAGLTREIKEETGLTVTVIGPANTWFGRWQENWLLSIDYLTVRQNGTLALSEEHSDHRWVTLKNLEKGDVIQLDPNFGFQLEDFKYAYRLYHLLVKNKMI